MFQKLESYFLALLSQYCWGFFWSQSLTYVYINSTRRHGFSQISVFVVFSTLDRFAISAFAIFFLFWSTWRVFFVLISSWKQHTAPGAAYHKNVIRFGRREAAAFRIMAKPRNHFKMMFFSVRFSTAAAASKNFVQCDKQIPHSTLSTAVGVREQPATVK